MSTWLMGEDWVSWSWVWSSMRTGVGGDVDCWADSGGLVWYRVEQGVVKMDRVVNWWVRATV